MISQQMESIFPKSPLWMKGFPGNNEKNISHPKSNDFNMLIRDY